MNAEKKIDALKKCGYTIDSDEMPTELPGCRVVYMSKTTKVTSRDPFGNATGAGERLVKKELVFYPDGTCEEL